MKHIIIFCFLLALASLLLCVKANADKNHYPDGCGTINLLPFWITNPDIELNEDDNLYCQSDPINVINYKYVVIYNIAVRDFNNPTIYDSYPPMYPAHWEYKAGFSNSLEEIKKIDNKNILCIIEIKKAYSCIRKTKKVQETKIQEKEIFEQNELMEVKQ